MEMITAVEHDFKVSKPWGESTATTCPERVEGVSALRLRQQLAQHVLQDAAVGVVQRLLRRINPD
jgi:hypothetical protein